MEFTIFYSWQSMHHKANKSLIQKALEDAIKQIKTSDTFTLQPVLDRDTQGIPGSPSIADSIFNKIAQCGLFVCDVTFVANIDTERPVPNPNVLIELGYAAAVLGWERIISVMNEAYGEADLLPFDLQHRRWPIRYKLYNNGSTTENLREIRQNLSSQIEYAIRSAIQSGVIRKKISPKDKRLARRIQKIIHKLTGRLVEFERGTETNTGYRFTEPPTLEQVSVIFSQGNLAKQSGLFTLDEGEQWSWSRVLIDDLARFEEDLDHLLSRYSERDDNLVYQIEMLVSEVQDFVRYIRGVYVFDFSSGLIAPIGPEYSDVYEFLCQLYRTQLVIEEYIKGDFTE